MRITRLMDRPVIRDVAFTANADGSIQHYIVQLPGSYATDKRADMLIAFHGHGSDRRQFIHDDRDECRAVRDFSAKQGMILVSPDYRASTSWMGPKAEADVVQIIEDVKKEYNIARVFVCGGSMGGASTLTFAALHPELVAGAAAMNGMANHLEYGCFQDCIQESFGGSKSECRREYIKRSAEFAPGKLTMPVGLTTSGKDDMVPPQSVIRLAKVLAEQGSPVLLIHREEMGHSTQYPDAMAILDFMLAKASEP